MLWEKGNQTTSNFVPLESVRLRTDEPTADRLVVQDGAGRIYVDRKVQPRRWTSFAVRGTAGLQLVTLLDAAGNVVEEQRLRLQPYTQLRCDKGPYAKLLNMLQHMITSDGERSKPLFINGRSYNLLICWSRDHVYTLKAAKYFIADVQSGLDYWLESQLPNGMFWDCIYENTEAPAPTWLGEALGPGWFKYDDGMKYIVRRVPVLADTEYVFTEGVWYAWKATGDDAWMARQLPRLEKALTYMTTDPLRWSKQHGLVRRSFTADEWDFANPHYCAGDHRCIHPKDPTFLFHGNQSGLYAMYWRMAEMYEHLGDVRRAKELRKEGEALRQRANAKLFFGNVYGHMIPEVLEEKKVYDLVGDERRRMSLSTGYTINRKLPTHAMAVKIIKEYQRRGQEKKKTSFAEWWTMDPSYSAAQWPGQQGHAGCPEGEYMNGSICTIIAGEIAKAAFDHGLEAYGVDILERVWRLTQRDGGYLHQAYKRLPENPALPKTRFQHVNLRSLANRGLKHGAAKNVVAWTDEGANDLRNLPTGKRKFGAIPFDVINPATNAGRAVVNLNADPTQQALAKLTIPVAHHKAAGVYFLHCLAHPCGRDVTAAFYDVLYADGTTVRLPIREGHEIGLWWGASDQAVDRNCARRAWWGANPTWKNVGIYMFGWNNPHPDKPITAIRMEALRSGEKNGNIMLAGITMSDQPVAFAPAIHSYGLPNCWAQAAVYYALAEGLAGIEDQGAAFSTVHISPRWVSTPAGHAAVTLHYPASDGYCSYSYRQDRKRRKITLDITGSFTRANIHCLLPAKTARRVTIAGAAQPFQLVRVERSVYVDFVLTGLPRGPVVIEY